MRNTRLDWLLTILSAAILAAATLYIAIHWGQLPDEIPIHYSFSGEPDDFGGKGALILDLCLGWGIILLLAIVEKFPQLWNFPVEVTVQNRSRLLRIAKKMMGILKLLTAGLFSVIAVTAAKSEALSAWISIGFLAAITITVIAGIGLMFRNR